jgi:flagellar hook assembly protein FlgD
MIRAIVEDVNVGSNDTDIPENRITLSNYPNPFNPVTNISFSLTKAGETSIKVYNLKGQLVNVLLDTYLEAGEMNLIWDGTDLKGNSVTSGLYFYTLENDNKKISKKMILLK